MNFKQWNEYFDENADHFEHFEWNGHKHLTTSEKKDIFKSIQQFQRGENSEGKHLYCYALKTRHLFYIETIKLFIREEQRHEAQRVHAGCVGYGHR